MKIKPLEYVIEGLIDEYKVFRLPNSKEMMDKINEIVEVVNNLSKNVSDINYEKQAQDMRKHF